jgi:S-adenosylmethionine hydrolase
MDVFVKVACHIAKGGLLNVIGREINSIKQVFELKSSVDNNMLKGHVIYIDHFGNVTNITKKTCRGCQRSSRDFNENQKYQNHFTYSAIASSDKYPIKNYEGEKIFNEAGFLEIAIFRSNPSKVGSASSLGAKLSRRSFDSV